MVLMLTLLPCRGVDWPPNYENQRDALNQLILAAPEQYADYDRGKGQSVTESLLTKDKGYDFIVANNDDMILGALQVVRQFNLTGKIHMAGVDGLPEALEAIKKGELDATVFQDPEGQGGGGVWGCYLALDGVKLPKDILIPFKLVNKDNVDDFLAIAKRVYVK